MPQQPVSDPLTPEQILGLESGTKIDVRVSGRVVPASIDPTVRAELNLGTYYTFTLKELADPKRFAEVRMVYPVLRPGETITPQHHRRLDAAPILTIIRNDTRNYLKTGQWLWADLSGGNEATLTSHGFGNVFVVSVPLDPPPPPAEEPSDAQQPS